MIHNDENCAYSELLKATSDICLQHYTRKGIFVAYI